MPTTASPRLDNIVQTPPDRRPRWQQRVQSTRLVVGVCVLSAAALVMLGVHLYSESPPAFMDLDVYRKGVQAWWHGKNMYGVLPKSIGGLYLPFIYPPFAALVFGPLAALPWTASAIAMLAISMIGLAVVIYLTVRQVWPAGGRRGALFAVAVLLVAAFKLQPVWDTLWFGQINIALMLLVALDCLVRRPKWPRGLLVGIAAAVKLTPAVFVLYFLVRKDYKSALTAAISGAAATAIGFLVSPGGSVQYWFGASGGARSVSGSTYYTNQTIDAFLARLALPKHTQTVLWLVLVAIVAVFAIGAIHRAHRMGNAPLAMAATGCFGLVASPTSWGHHWVYVVPGLVVMASYAIRLRSVGWTVATVCTALVFWIAPFEYLPNSNNRELTWAWWQQLPGNAYTIVGVTLLVVFGFPTVSQVVRRQLARATTTPTTAPTTVPATGAEVATESADAPAASVAPVASVEQPVVEGAGGEGAGADESTGESAR